MDNTGTLAPSQGGSSTETQNAPESQGQGSVDTQGSQGQSDNAGGSQGFSEGGKDNGTDTRRPQFRSKNQTIYELRQKNRELEDRYKSDMETVNQRLSKFEEMFSRGQNQKPSRTFWEAPEEVLEERLANHMSAMEERLAQRWQENQTNSQRTSEWKQETSEATKFLRSQPGFTEDDEQELARIVIETPLMNSLTPMQKAEYALYLYNKEKGVTDKTPLKQKAAGVIGATPNQQSPTNRVWTEAEMESEMVKLGDPKNWTKEQSMKAKDLEMEFRKAYTEKRVKRS